MASRLSRRSHAWTFAATLLLGGALSLSGCGGGAVTVVVTPTASASGGAAAGTATSAGGSSSAATPAPAAAPPHAFAWYQYDSGHAPQIWASLSGASPTQITHIGPPSADGCDTEVAWSPPVFSPDLTHIVAALGSFGCGDGDLHGPVSVITRSGGAISAVPGNYDIRLTERDAGWVNSSTIWFVTNDNIYTYTLGAASASPLPGISHPVEAAVRGSTLFWESVANSTSTWSYTLHRYDLGTHSALAGTISLGAWGACQCSPGDFHTPGWDASPNGSHIVYQVVTPSGSSSGGITSSKIYYASADGSGATQIAHYMVTTQMAKLQISPNGQWVAFTNALPSPATLTASVSTPGGAGDSTFHGYSPDTYNYPVWKWDSTQFWAGKVDAADGDPGASTGALYRFNLGGSSAVGVSGGYNPWYTIGS